MRKDALALTIRHAELLFAMAVESEDRTEEEQEALLWLARFLDAHPHAGRAEAMPWADYTWRYIDGNLRRDVTPGQSGLHLVSE